MSKILYEIDNLNIIGDIIPYENCSREEWKITTKKEYRLDLLFNIYINWKLKTIKQDFKLVKWENRKIEISNYEKWYAIHELLFWLWYKILMRDDWEINIHCNIINRWVNQLEDHYWVQIDL